MALRSNPCPCSCAGFQSLVHMKNPSVNPHFQVIQMSGSTPMPMLSSHRFLTPLAFHDSPGRKQVLLSISLFRPGFSSQKRTAKQRHHRIQRFSVIAEQPASKDAVEVVIPEKSVSVILLAGGKGKRMGANMPKQYLPLLGQPIALYSFHTFASMAEVAEIVVVCDPSYRDIFEDAKVTIPFKFALPGKERQDSVRSGLQEISRSSRLACIHDSARPLVLPKDILKVLKDAWTTGAAVLGVPVKATIKEAGNDRFVSRTLNRQVLWEMQTPQVIEPQLLHRGFELVEREGYEVTDDASIVEYLKHPVLITEGSYTNLKVTTPDDLLVAERILNQSMTLAA